MIEERKCSCGLSFHWIEVAIDDLLNELGKKKLNGTWEWEALSTFKQKIDSEKVKHQTEFLPLESIEKDCGLDLNKEKDTREKALSDIADQRWENVREKIHYINKSVGGKMDNCRDKEKGYGRYRRRS